MTSLGVVELARRFWALAGGEPGFPRDLRGALTWALPVTVVELGDLRLSQVVAWLTARELPGPLAGPDRPLRAAVVGRAEQGLIFLDGNDPVDERRFSLAHEVAHYLEECWELRGQVAARVGRPALEVLDGRRPPRQAERIDAVLAGLELSPALHLMERTAWARPSGWPTSWRWSCWHQSRPSARRWARRPPSWRRCWPPDSVCPRRWRRPTRRD